MYYMHVAEHSDILHFDVICHLRCQLVDCKNKLYQVMPVHLFVLSQDVMVVVHEMIHLGKNHFVIRILPFIMSWVIEHKQMMKIIFWFFSFIWCMISEYSLNFSAFHVFIAVLHTSVNTFL